ncbi:hypothetical protein PANT111_190269 [Pantoea brenneri]|uniref:Uncharacterized protein n=1 Tax=Pantoea brenneri TaxID=472694 RepID=A0AAX3J759_9GAMM|nr:hypothetical protein PANT111_190269 [Pantoea brenneri]
MAFFTTSARCILLLHSDTFPAVTVTPRGVGLMPKLWADRPKKIKCAKKRLIRGSARFL